MCSIESCSSLAADCGVEWCVSELGGGGGGSTCGAGVATEGVGVVWLMGVEVVGVFAADFCASSVRARIAARRCLE